MVTSYEAEAKAAEGAQTQKKSEKPSVNQQVLHKLKQESSFSIRKPGK